MAIKPQDIVVLAKLLVSPTDKAWSQSALAEALCLSPSQVNSAFKRLVNARLVSPYRPPEKPLPILGACEEFFIHGLKYTFPARAGEVVRGIPTSYTGPTLSQKIVQGNAPIPVWPYGEGTARGAMIKPLYSCVPESVTKHPDPLFYDLLTLLDAIRSGRARERNLAAKAISEIIQSR